MFTRPGAITSKLRRAWGLEGQKKVDGERVADDRHHAIDAVVLAATTEGLLQWMTRQVQQREREGRGDDIFHVAPPWRGFREDSIASIYGEGGVGGIFVSRAERPRARGKAHDATIRQIREIDGEEVVFERKAIEKLTEADLDKIPVPAPYGAIVDPAETARRDGRGAARLDRRREAEGRGQAAAVAQGRHHSQGARRSKNKVGIRLNGGAVDRGEMARVDVFPQGEQEGHLAILSRADLSARNRDDGRAADAGGFAGETERNWPVMDSTFEFLWSIESMAFLEASSRAASLSKVTFAAWIERPAPSRFRHRIAIPTTVVAASASRRSPRSRNSASIASVFRTEVTREVRTWHGKACT